LYNTILKARERYGRHASPRIVISEFQEWLDSDDILYLPTTGASFIWSNGKRGSRKTEKHFIEMFVINSGLIAGLHLIGAL